MTMNDASSTSAADEQQANRLRYDALRAAGQGATAKALPPLTARSHAIDDQQVLHREHLPGGWYWSTRLAAGEALRLVNTSGRSTVSLVAWCADDPSERLNVPDTVKVQWSVALRKGRILLTDMGRVMFSIVEDTSGAHDAAIGPTTRSSVAARSGPGAAVPRNSRDNFLAATAKLGLSRRDVPACINFFAPVGVDAQGKYLWRDGLREPGDFVDLRAEMACLVVLSNAGHPLDPAPQALPAAVDVIRFASAAPGASDACRHAGVEAERAFEFTERHLREKGLP